MTTSTESAEPSVKKYAIVRTGGKQYVVEVGKRVTVDLIDAEVGAEIQLDEVLYVSASEGRTPAIGAPLVEGASVKARVSGHVKDKKVIIFKKRNRTGYTKKQGHRQGRTEILIDSILG